jgi:serine protease Do
VLTNFHVARDALRIQATLSNGVSLEAEVLAHDPLTDLSVLRLRPRPGTREIPELSPAPLAEDAVVSVGEPVLAMGNPFALSSSVTIGIVSNPRRVFRDRSGTDIEELESSDGDSSGLLTQWIQHDALILPGNSGGPLVNLKGEVIGINQLGGTGLGFAIPLSVARKVLNRVLSGKGLERGDLGVRVAPVGRLGQTEGALVSWVRPGSSAEQSGLQPGDRLLELAGEALQVQFVEQVPEFYQRVAELPVGVPVEVVFERGGKRLKQRILVERLDVQVGLEGEVLELGLSVRKVTPAFALVRNLPLERGWWVSGVRPGYPGATARPAIQAGDVLLAIDGKAVAELRGYGVPPPAEGGRWLIELQRGGERILSVARPLATRSGRVGGELPKPWLGVRTQVLTEELARALGLPQAGGFRVTEVLPWTEAERAGLQVGDLLIAIDQNPLEARRQQDSAELQRLIEERSIGEMVTLGVRRGSERLNIPVRLETRPVASEEVDMTRQEDFEFTARDLTFLDRAELLRDREIQGVFVSEVSSGGWADLAGLAVGDVILAVDGQQTPSVRKLEEALQRVLRERKEVVPFFVRRGKRTQFLFVEAAWQDRGSKEDL